jgi:galactose mutarotase-like enzyme
VKLSIRNEELSADIQTHGAELCSLRSADGVEYLWQAEPSIWPRHAPILFPIVGKLRDNRYTLSGQPYELTQHGFARDCQFEVESHTREMVTFLLTDSDRTRTHYPFNFELRIGYRLSRASLIVQFDVRNTGAQTLWFSIGAHPAFNCPLLPNEKRSDYILEFSEAETIGRFPLVDGLLATKMEPLLQNQRVLHLSPSLFDRDALVLKQPASDNLTLKSVSSGRGVRVEFPGWPYLGIWSKPGNALFVCIEPWFGLADSNESTGELTKKEAIISLLPKSQFTCEHWVVVF